MEASGAAARASRLCPRETARAGGRASTAVSVGIISTFLTVIVVLPSAAHAFWQAVSNPLAVAALKLTFGAAFIVVLINGILGTVTAWVLVRDNFRGKSL